MRIIAGTLRSRRLTAPPGKGTRPTSDRAREGLFSMLGSLHGLKVLDLFAGTGALGLEALSRGASHAVFVESGRHALDCLLANITALDLTNSTTVLRCPVERAGSELTRLAPFDLIFCDPPWNNVRAAWLSLDAMGVTNWLSIGARLVLEHPAAGSPSEAPIKQLDVWSARTWGDSAVTILERPRDAQQT